MHNTQELAQSISVQDLRILGINEIAYIKPDNVDGATVFTVHAADGTAIAQMASHEIAVAAVRQNNMEAVSIH